MHVDLLVFLYLVIYVIPCNFQKAPLICTLSGAGHLGKTVGHSGEFGLDL